MDRADDRRRRRARRATTQATSSHVGGVAIELLHTPGHTPGSQCLLVDGRLVTGDTLFLDGCGRTDLPGSDPAEMYETLTRRLAADRRRDRRLPRPPLLARALAADGRDARAQRRPRAAHRRRSGSRRSGVTPASGRAARPRRLGRHRRCRPRWAALRRGAARPRAPRRRSRSSATRRTPPTTARRSPSSSSRGSGTRRAISLVTARRLAEQRIDLVAGRRGDGRSTSRDARVTLADGRTARRRRRRPRDRARTPRWLPGTEGAAGRPRHPHARPQRSPCATSSTRSAATGRVVVIGARLHRRGGRVDRRGGGARVTVARGARGPAQPDRRRRGRGRG